MELTLAPQSLEAALDDLSLRFLVNLPPGELESVDRLFFQLQQAHWYYLDFFVEFSPDLPKLSFRDFSRAMFEHCPLLRGQAHRFEELREGFKEYMSSIPVYGCILLNSDMTRVLMLRPWKGKHWVFPKGKVNEGEEPIDCAAREALEEVGFNPLALLKASGGEFLSIRGNNPDQPTRFYIGVGAPDDGSVEYRPLTRSEVSEIGWFELEALPDDAGQPKAKRFWTMLSLFRPLKQWVANRKGQPAASKKKRARAPKGGEAPYYGSTSSSYAGAAAGAGGYPGSGSYLLEAAFSSSIALAPAPLPMAASAPATGKKKKAKKAKANGGAGTLDAAPIDPLNSALEGDGSNSNGGAASWSVADMFKANERLLGKRFVYDGNPHLFGDASVQAVDHGQALPGAAAPGYNKLRQRVIAAYQLGEGGALDGGLEDDDDIRPPPLASSSSLSSSSLLAKTAGVTTTAASAKKGKGTGPGPAFVQQQQQQQQQRGHGRKGKAALVSMLPIPPAITVSAEMKERIDRNLSAALIEAGMGMMMEGGHEIQGQGPEEEGDFRFDMAAILREMALPSSASSS